MIRAGFGLVILCLSVVPADEQEARHGGAEQRRLPRDVFRQGLKDRNLTHLLDLHLRDFPPTDQVEALLGRSQVKRSAFGDTALSIEERRRAVIDANRLLRDLIRTAPRDPRRFHWRYRLAHSLIYDEAQPYWSEILFRGGRPSDRLALREIASRAVTLLKLLLRDFQREYERIDAMSLVAFEQSDIPSYIESIDLLGPEAKYLQTWALFYDALPKAKEDPARVPAMQQVLERLDEHPGWMETPHIGSGIQIQSLLLGGLVSRRLGDYETARNRLDRCLDVVSKLSMDHGAGRDRWAETLARIERVRNERDAEEFKSASEHLVRLRVYIERMRGNEYGLRIVSALLERSIRRAQAGLAAGEGRSADAARFRERAWMALSQLAQEVPERRNQLYSFIHGQLDNQAKLSGLDDFELCALSVGLLNQAESDQGDVSTILERVVSIGDYFLANRVRAAGPLISQVAFNTAVAQYRLGQIVDGVRRFQTVARRYSRSIEAPRAAALAVQLASGLHRDAITSGDRAHVQLYRGALETLFSFHSQTDAASYWRFFYAQLLDEQHQWREAAEQYRMVDQKHEHYLEGLYFRTRCLSRVVIEESDALDDPVFYTLTDRFLSAYLAFERGTAESMHRRTEADHLARVYHLETEAKILTAETEVHPRVRRAAQALDRLRGLEMRQNLHPDWAQRVLRVRLLAYEQLGRVDEAMRILPNYIAADPEGSGVMLQTLYESMSAGVDRFLLEGDREAAQRRAESALVVAQHIHMWVKEGGDVRTLGIAVSPDVQYAEANLRAGRFDVARKLLGPMIGSDGITLKSGVATRSAQGVRIRASYAETLYQLGEYELALPVFNKLATTLSANGSLRWQALLRDLQCRTELQHPPGGIIKVILQQKTLYPAMGGEAFWEKFETLRQQNESRSDDDS